MNLLIFLALGGLWRTSCDGEGHGPRHLGSSGRGWVESDRAFSDPVAPDVLPVVLASLGAIAINGTSAWLLAWVRDRGGSLSRAAFLSARNDVLVNVAVIVMGIVTPWTNSGWPDLSWLLHYPVGATRRLRGLGGQRGGATRREGARRRTDRLT